jgi:hypothetical protein
LIWLYVGNLETLLMAKFYFKIFTGLLLGSGLMTAGQTLALPSPTDLPEEYLRTQIIFEARSPITGEALTAADYAELLTSLGQELQKQDNAAFVSKYRETLYLLRLRKLLKNLGIPIK